MLLKFLIKYQISFNDVPKNRAYYKQELKIGIIIIFY